MVDKKALETKIKEQSEKSWDNKSIVSWFKKLTKDGISKKAINPAKIIANKQQILDRIQRRGEECEFLSHS